MRQIMRSSLDYAGFAQLCGRSEIMREIMRAHNRIIPRSLVVNRDVSLPRDLAAQSLQTQQPHLLQHRDRRRDITAGCYCIDYSNQRPHRYCHLANSVENIDREQVSACTLSEYYPPPSRRSVRSRGWTGPHSIGLGDLVGPHESTSQTTSRLLQRRFCTAHNRDQPTHTQTDHATCVATSRIYATHAYASMHPSGVA